MDCISMGSKESNMTKWLSLHFIGYNYWHIVDIIIRKLVILFNELKIKHFILFILYLMLFLLKCRSEFQPIKFFLFQKTSFHFTYKAKFAEISSLNFNFSVKIFISPSLKLWFSWIHWKLFFFFSEYLKCYNLNSFLLPWFLKRSSVYRE